MINKRAVRYGKDRLFEQVPDGAIIAATRKDLTLLYDTKAYKGGYSISSDDIERYANYINTFNQKYESYVGRVYSFLLISGNFKQGQKSLKQRSEQLYSKCQTTLTCITSIEIGEIVQTLKSTPKMRESINWRRVFSSLRNIKVLVEKEIKQIQKDRVLGE